MHHVCLRLIIVVVQVGGAVENKICVAALSGGAQEKKGKTG
jgi:hypothetical protein